MIGDRTRFLKVMEGLEFPDPKGGWPVGGLLFPASVGTGARLDSLDGEQTEISKALELVCLAGQTSSLGPGVSGVKTNPSAIYKSTDFPRVI